MCQKLWKLAVFGSGPTCASGDGSATLQMCLFQEKCAPKRFNLSPFPRGPRLQHLDFGTLCLALPSLNRRSLKLFWTTGTRSVAIRDQFLIQKLHLQFKLTTAIFCRQNQDDSCLVLPYTTVMPTGMETVSNNTWRHRLMYTDLYYKTHRSLFNITKNTKIETYHCLNNITIITWATYYHSIEIIY